MTAFVSFDRVFEVLDTPNPIQDRPGAVDLVEPAGRIELDDVWFPYPTAAEASVASLETPGALPDVEEGRPVLRGVDGHDRGRDDDRPGRAVGRGQVDPRLAHPPPLRRHRPGAVRVDGHDVRDLTQRSLRGAIGVVTQDPHLFHETVRSNLRYARPDATDDELEAACRAARIWDVIAALPDGYDTLVGERGYRLSGGEKQRLAIARMLLKDPCIVILDEATSHLDSENEAAVQAALDEALRGRTSVVIAHRLSTIIAADQILVLDEGQIVERGTHVAPPGPAAASTPTSTAPWSGARTRSTPPRPEPRPAQGVGLTRPGGLAEARRGYAYTMRGTAADEREDQRVQSSPHPEPGTSDGPELVDRPFPAAPADATPFAFTAELQPVRNHTRTWAMGHEVPIQISDDLVLAVDELAANSVRHGGGGGELRLWTESARHLVAEITDHGWIRDRAVGRQLPPIDQAHGRGLWIANALADRLQIWSTPDGTVVRAHFDPS